MVKKFAFAAAGMLLAWSANAQQSPTPPGTIMRYSVGHGCTWVRFSPNGPAFVVGPAYTPNYEKMDEALLSAFENGTAIQFYIGTTGPICPDMTEDGTEITGINMAR